MIFLITIFFTLFEDLLVGIAAGILTKFIFHFINGVSLKCLFKAHFTQHEEEGVICIKVQESAVFSNLIGFKRLLTTLPEQGRVDLDLSATILVDHSFMAFINHFANEYNYNGGDFHINGLENHKSFSNHPLSTRKLKKEAIGS